MKMKTTLARLNALHQQKHDTVENISLAHIDVQAINRASSKRAVARTTKNTARAAAHAAAFAIGQSVRTKLNDRMTGQPMVAAVSAIEGAVVTLDNGRKFSASALVAA